MAAIEGRSVPRLSLLLALGASSACAAGGRDEGLFVEDAGAPFGVGKNNFPGVSAPQDDAGRASLGARECGRPDLFVERVLPAFMKDCVRCHNGTKGKATRSLNLTFVGAGDTQAACDATLNTTMQADPAKSTILSVVDPSDPSTSHDFKYATPAEYAVYRDGVLTWLMAE